MERTLIENMAFQGRVDREKKMIRGVSVLSGQSRNTDAKGRPRKYSDAALNEAKTYFDGAPVFLEHEKEKRARDLAGELRNLAWSENRIIGDLLVTENHSWLFDVAERFPHQVGLSIMATGRVRETDQGEIVEGFAEGKRRSVDLITEPATVKNLFEQKLDMEDKPKMEMEELKAELEAAQKRIAELEAELEAAKPKEEEKAEPKEEEKAEKYVAMENRILAQEKKIESLLTEKQKSEKEAKVERLIIESKIQRTDAFVSALLRCEKDEEMKALIDDRKSAQRGGLISRGITEHVETKKAGDLEKEILEALK